MKTKIIYISGNEVFDMADIRAAFDTVRGVLGLDNDTVLFGVPVDKDDAIANTDESGVETTITKPVVSVPEIDHHVTDSVPESEPIPVLPDTHTEKPKRASRRTAAKVVPISSVKDATDNVDNQPPADETQKPAIPILSVLGAKPEDITPDETPDETPNTDADTAPDTIDITPVDNTNIETDNRATTTISDSDTQTVSIADMLADDTMPTEPGEKTLEELLESMTPLAADEKPAPIIETPAEPDMESEPNEEPTDDTDATLELLATEFAEAEDKIVPSIKPESRGKIGKLKNILPFKKAKRDDGGIMGDLFGWAGVANDEDFTIPGFFTNASSKK